MIEQERYNIHPNRWREKQHGLTTLTIGKVPLIVSYTYDNIAKDIEKVKIYLDSAPADKVDLTDLLWDRYDEEITRAIMEVVK